MFLKKAVRLSACHATPHGLKSRLPFSGRFLVDRIGTLERQVVRSSGFLAVARRLGAVERLHGFMSRQNDIHDDADKRSDRQAGKGDRDGSDRDDDRARCAVGNADGQHDNECRDDDVAALGEIDMVLDEVTDADRRDHAVEDQRHAADDACGHDLDDRGELRAKREDDREHGRQTDDAWVEDPGERQHPGILSIGGVRRSTEQRGQNGCEAVS